MIQTQTQTHQTRKATTYKTTVIGSLLAIIMLTGAMFTTAVLGSGCANSLRVHSRTAVVLHAMDEQSVRVIEAEATRALQGTTSTEEEEAVIQARRPVEDAQAVFADAVDAYVLSVAIAGGSEGRGIQKINMQAVLRALGISVTAYRDLVALYDSIRDHRSTQPLPEITLVGESLDSIESESTPQ